MRLDHDLPRELADLLRMERLAFAAKLRIARAALGWSQSELGARAGLTQRAIHKLEQGETEPHRRTIVAIEEIWREEGIEFEELDAASFRVTIRTPVLDRARQSKSRKGRLRYS